MGADCEMSHHDFKWKMGQNRAVAASTATPQYRYTTARWNV